ncbi:MAG: desulfoferrodoxin [Gemmatimonadota bacterium]|nr:desulfoferrodoxin [Gemmatimonadota bacterium]
MATEILQVYKCSACGNIVLVLHTGAGELVCCGRPMNLLTENTTDAAVEKHVPVVEKADGGIRIKVGSVAHPMQDDHYIEWIEVQVDGKTYHQFLGPGGAPEAFFAAVEGDRITVRAYCNLHGLWKSE